MPDPIRGSTPQPRPRYERKPKPVPAPIAEVIESSTGRWPVYTVRWREGRKVVEAEHRCVSWESAQAIADQINAGNLEHIPWVANSTLPWGAFRIAHDVSEARNKKEEKK